MIRGWHCRRIAWIVPAVYCVWLPVVRVEARPAGTIRIDAWHYDRGNAKVFPNPDIYADYRDKHPDLVVGDGGESPWTIEYDVDAEKVKLIGQVEIVKATDHLSASEVLYDLKTQKLDAGGSEEGVLLRYKPTKSED